MFKKIGGAILLALLFATPAAASGPWDGFYVGAVGTLGNFSSDDSDHWCYVACNGPSQSSWGGGIGGTFGKNWQDGSFVMGLEGDVSWSDFKNSLTTPCGSLCYSIESAKWDWYATLRARFGLAVDNTLVYATGGVAFVGDSYRADYHYTATGAWDGGYLPKSNTDVGVAVGAGVEHRFNDNLSFKAEFLYIGLPSTNGGVYYNASMVPASPSGGVVIYRSSAEVFRIGLNWQLD